MAGQPADQHTCARFAVAGSTLSRCRYRERRGRVHRPAHARGRSRSRSQPDASSCGDSLLNSTTPTQSFSYRPDRSELLPPGPLYFRMQPGNSRGGSLAWGLRVLGLYQVPAREEAAPSWRSSGGSRLAMLFHDPTGSPTCGTWMSGLTLQPQLLREHERAGRQRPADSPSRLRRTRLQERRRPAAGRARHLAGPRSALLCATLVELPAPPDAVRIYAHRPLDLCLIPRFPGPARTGQAAITRGELGIDRLIFGSYSRRRFNPWFRSSGTQWGGTPPKNSIAATWHFGPCRWSIAARPTKHNLVKHTTHRERLHRYRRRPYSRIGHRPSLAVESICASWPRAKLHQPQHRDPATALGGSPPHTGAATPPTPPGPAHHGSCL